jgi:hypothetical protein
MVSFPGAGRMIGQYPEETIEHVRSLSPIEQVVREYVRLRRSGPGFIGLCPFHSEETPSFRVNTDERFHCFGCGLGGDVFDFIQRLRDVSFPQAVRQLAERAGFKMDGFKPSPELSAKVRALREERERELDFEKFCEQRIEAISRQYRGLARAATYAENCLRAGGLMPSEELMAWDALERYRKCEVRVEREELCEEFTLRTEWLELRGNENRNSSSSIECDEHPERVLASPA